MEASVDTRRAKLVFKRLLHALRSRQYPYNTAQLPQHQIPDEIRRDPLRHSQFIFYVCHFMRGAIQSDMAIKQLVALWRKEPGLFEPEKVADMSEEHIRASLFLALNYHLDEIAAFWLKNSQSLMRRWRGDPRLIFKSASCGESARRLITNKKIKGEKPNNEIFEHEWGFEGFQGKMASMLAYFLMDAKLIEPMALAPAVDFHLLRVMLATQIITVDDDRRKRGFRYDQVYPYGVSLLEEYCKKSGTSSVEIGDALWIISWGLCSIAPGNGSVGRGQKNPNGKKVLPGRLRVDPHNSEHLERYETSCHRCPVQHLCKWNVPSGPYYEVGNFMLDERMKLKSRPTLFPTLPDHPAPNRQRAGALQSPEESSQLWLDGMPNPEPDG